MTKQAPYKHYDGSGCWTKNCSKGNTNFDNMKHNLRVGGTDLTFAEFEQQAQNQDNMRNTKIVTHNEFIEPTKFEPHGEFIYTTIHGSHLYGLNHAGSDEDYYSIVYGDGNRSNAARNKTKQTIINGIDTVKVSLNHFMQLARDGSHQALEAMFSEKTYGDSLEGLRKNYYVGTEIFSIYERTIRNFALSNDFKRRRHGLRLMLNLNEMVERGRFNPTLTAEEAKTITDKTNGTFDQYFDYINQNSIIEIQWSKTDRAHTVRR